jgi:hypothetical protein
MRSRGFEVWSACGALVLMLSGCAPGSGEEAASPTSLLDVEIPADFTFATTKGLTVRGEGDATRLAATLAEVRLPNGELLHRGPLSLAIELAIPTAAETLTVVLRGPDGERTETVSARGAEAVVTVE